MTTNELKNIVENMVSDGVIQKHGDNQVYRILFQNNQIKVWK